MAVDIILLSFVVKLNREPRSYSSFKGNDRSYLSVPNTRTRALNRKTFFNIKAFGVLGIKGVNPSLSNVIGL